MAYEEVDAPDRSSSRYFLENMCNAESGEFVFLSAFDSFSFVQRKNPIGVVQAFQTAFPQGAKVRLIMKTHNKDLVTDPVQMKMWSTLEGMINDDPRISVINETLSYGDLIKLKVGSDCYVSLHKSEGWGFGMIEAMSLGIPVIATGYSGNMEFCSEETCGLVDYDMKALDRDDYIFVVPGQQWAEPRIESAARQMALTFSDRALRENRAANAKAFVSQKFSPDAVSTRYLDRIREIISKS